MLYTSDLFKISQYFLNHPHVFSEYEMNYILWYASSLEKNIDVPYYVLELYDELGILPKNRNVYQAFINLLKCEHNITNKNILEVGGGILPRVAERINLSKKNGSITVYDPRLSQEIGDSPSFKLKREKFSQRTSSDGVDLLIGLKPCEVVEDMIRWATTNRVDFMIGMCDGGYHGEPYDYFDSTREWLDAMIYLAYRGVEDNDMGKLKIKKLDVSNYNYPVIYNSR